MAKTINEIIKRYYDEADGGMVQKAPSALKRGEGTEKEYFIFKIDLVGSTIFVFRKSHQTYLKLAHTFLSAIDEITRAYGADGNQVEYAGDSVIAYFPESVGAGNVLAAAYYCRQATLQMRSLDASVKNFPCNTKVVVHFGKLIMAKIGPYGDSFVSAIGPAVHKACKMEKDVPAGEGRASKEFGDRLNLQQRRLFLNGNCREMQVLSQAQPVQPNPSALTGGLLGFREYTHLRGNALAAALGQKSAALPPSILSGLAIPQPPIPQFETKRELIDYSINWAQIQRYINAGKFR